MIGIDSPETGECLNQESTNKMKELILNKSVKLEMDTTQGERDFYDRLLAYLFLEDGTFINKKMIKSGYAEEYTYDDSYKYKEEFKNAEIAAKENKRGMWANDVCNTSNEEENNSVTPKQEEDQSQDGLSYDCSGNIYNCSDFSTHLEAQNVYEYCGGVSNDIHRLDRDKDGKACESLPQ